MLPYAQLQAESLVLLLGYGLVGLLALVLAHAARELHVGRKSEDAGPPRRFPSGVEEGHGPIPVFLLVLYVALAVWAVLYVLAHALGGMDFAG